MLLFVGKLHVDHFGDDVALVVLALLISKRCAVLQEGEPFALALVALAGAGAVGACAGGGEALIEALPHGDLASKLRASARGAGPPLAARRGSVFVST
eukprot:CAMPEP_0115868288 /NCGR_PEP_ID=MMETSP0287-20121206/21214_1 /TAXON_ID=412157 /ORGANISM="Chrysochromulina rotalis, Strain UIO044" /LENGTH=97 /DNA_ID=CAMNT_0003322935 /DNA_START=625 /DNA_END=914 /DNA_ORIENTATION=+